jgi:peptidoglycan/xylan/chitin deacetylase (PgdA/CDA1 family)
MALQHSLLSTLYPILRLLHGAGRYFRISKNGKLRVLLYHDIAPHDIMKFERQLRWLSTRWKFISPDEFASMMSGDTPIVGDNLLLTFDDGFASNRLIAETILKSMGIKALFFVLLDFVECEAKGNSQAFIRKNIFPGMLVKDMPYHWDSMRWTDLLALLDDGHTIGCHTRSHLRLSSIDTSDLLFEEVCNSANILEQRLGIRIEHFAYPFGDLGSIDIRAIDIAKHRYRFIHSGLRGNNGSDHMPFLIWRDSVTPNDSLNLLGTFLEGGGDWYYAKGREEFRALRL